MNARTRVLFAIGLAAIALTVLVFRGLDAELTDGDALAAPVPRAEEPAALEATDPEGGGARETTTREALSGPAAEPDELPAAAPDEPGERDVAVEPVETITLHGRVVTIGAEPLAGVAVGHEYDKRVEPARTEADGTFRIDVPRPAMGRCLIVAEPGYATVNKSCPNKTSFALDLVLVAAPSVDLAGQVIDDAGSPLSDAAVRVRRPPHLFAGFPFRLETTREVRWETRTDEEGRFGLTGVPANAWLLLRAEKKGFEHDEVEMPVVSTFDMTLTLAHKHVSEYPTVTGVVLHADRRPAKGASVRFGPAQTTTDEFGRFVLPTQRVYPETPLVAVKVGVQPAVLLGFAEQIADGEQPPPIELVLGPDALAIDGRVVDAVGEPCVSWDVSLLDGTVVSSGIVPPDLVEDMVRFGSDAIRTDDAGRFRLEGLAERSYTIRAYDPKSLVQVRSEPVAAGSSVVLRVPQQASIESVRGRVVSRRGDPVEGARVSSMLLTSTYQGGSSWVRGEGVLTDAQGWFELSGVPRDDPWFTVSGETVIPERRAVTVEEIEAGLVLEVARRCQVRFEGGAGVTAVEVVDEEGTVLPAYRFQSGSSMSQMRMTLSEGDSIPFAVSEDARAMVVYEGEQEVERLPLDLDPDELNVVRR